MCGREILFLVISSEYYKTATSCENTRRFLSLMPAAPLSAKDLNQLTLEAKYAVRGKIPIRADELRSTLKQDPLSLTFDRIISANIGNPQQLGQEPLTWYRQVLSILQYPKLAEADDLFPKDVISRARNILDSIGSIGAYSHSQGDSLIRKSVAEFISKRDGFPSNPDNIFLTGGASAAVSYLFEILSTSDKSGFLIPIPQYPLYTATISLNNAVPIGYFLDESNHWATNPASIRDLIHQNKQKGVEISALVVINPGNPTGAILERSDIVELINIAAEYGIVLIADEVYQNNIFEREFISVRKVLHELLEANPELYKYVQLASLHSTSKGVSGECGQRGGYMELVGFTQEVKDVVFKLASINLCSVVSGQALVELMVNPPKQGDPSYELYRKETTGIHRELQERATKLHAAFNKMEDITCNKPMGAMYLFPKLNFTKESYGRLFEAANQMELTVDELYCTSLLEETGICCIPGNGFGQVKGTFHLRTTFLPSGSEWIDKWSKSHARFVSKYKL